ncbi:MAG: beta-ribofuranosylaminobenzene 5'-phosphate synthase [Psychroserpens sp.]|jgi:beta-ribofuranosylaminobenzene 5'-phosphate synthase
MLNGIFQMVLINVPFRLHITLIAMHKCSYRKNGGIGLSVNTNCQLIAEEAEQNTISTNGYCNDDDKLKSICDVIESITIKRSLDIRAKFVISGDLYFHSGLGVGTAITLACIEAVFLLNKQKYNELDIKKLSGRGGTSGIGINSYFSGGFLLDLGHETDELAHTPSRYIQNAVPPLNIKTVPFLFDDLYMLLPSDLPTTSGEDERNFFDENTPIKAEQAHETCYLSIFGVLASICENNLDKFSQSIKDIQKTGWKSIEIERAGSCVKNIMSRLSELDCHSIGMSSLGNGVYFLLNQSVGVSKVQLLSDELNCKLLKLVPCNNGRSIEIV